MLDSLEVTEQKMYFKNTQLSAETFTGTFARSEESQSWVDSLPFEIPFGLATTFKSDEDWLDDWEEVDQIKRKPYTFDDRVEDYRFNHRDIFIYMGFIVLKERNTEGFEEYREARRGGE